jgi:CHAT domain-containing protein/tetratricopeptide (TPR) repeat protein
MMLSSGLQQLEGGNMARRWKILVWLFSCALTLCGVTENSNAQDSAQPSGNMSPQPQFDQADIDQRDAEAQRFFNIGQYAEAERLFRQNLSILNAAVGEDHSETQIALANVGVAAARQGRMSEGLPLVEKALHQLEQSRGPDDQDVIAMQGMLGNIYAETGRMDAALPLLRSVVTARERLLGPRDERTLLSKNNLAAGLRQAGALEESFAMFRNVAEMRKSVSGAEHPETIKADINLAEAMLSAGLYDEAELVFLSGLERTERLSLGPDATASALNNLGAMYVTQMRYAEAEPILKRAIEASDTAYGEDHPVTLAAVNNLANVLQFTDRPAGSVPLLERVLKTNERLYGRQHRLTMAAADNLAITFSLLDRLPEAEALLRKTAADRARFLPRSDPDRSASTYSLGAIYIGQRRFDEAQKVLTEVLSERIKLLGPESDRVMEVHDNLAMVQLFQPRRAAQALKPARVLVARARQRRGGSGADPLAELRMSQQAATHNDWFHYLAEAAWARAQARPDAAAVLRNEAFLALQDMVAGEASRAIARMAARRGADGAGSSLGVLAGEREASNQRWAAISQQYDESFRVTSDAQAISRRSDLVVERRGIEARMAEIDAVLRRDYPDYFNLIRPNALSIEETQRLLRPDEAVLLIVPGMFGTHTIAVSRDKVRWHRYESGEGVVEPAVERLRWNVGAIVRASPDRLAALEIQEQDRSELSFNRTTAHNLYRFLIAPADDVLDDKQRVYVVAGGSLAGLPFSLLVTAPPQGDDEDPDALRATPWFADQHALVHIPSLQSLATLRSVAAPQGRQDSFMGIGDPVIGADSAPRSRAASRRALSNVTTLRALERLPGTARELQRIQMALDGPESSLLLGAQATEPAIRGADLSGKRIIAFATHGLVAGDAGVTESGLVLTPPAKASAEDDGFLSASEVASLRLNADWVILSACNTATGDRGGTQGLGGLARSFFFAGARNLLASHWPVSDEVAPLLTVRVIELERKGMDRASAFQLAMREIRLDRRNDESASWAHPFYWAPFVLIGDGG